MPTLEERLRLAASLGPRAGVAALSAALVAAHETERPAITRMLLAAAHAGPDDPGLRALVREWALLDHEGRLGVMRLFEAAPAGALRQLLAKTDAEDQRAAALVAVVFVQDRAGARSFGAGVRWAGRDAVGERALMRAADGALAHAAGEYPGHRLPGLIE
ncbi:MAG TPA: hypothetical protein VG797_06450, partial [Phycisphaerales bacterium]|nr:hypothetical protein [Phycisphaerales bacterium]